MEIVETKDENCLIMKIIGELDTLSSPELNDKLNSIDINISKLILDLKELNYISSSGIRELVTALKIMDAREGVLILKNVGDFVLKVLSSSGIKSMFKII